MAGEQENINQIAGVIDDGVNTFLEGVEKSQTGIFNKTLSIVKELETDVNGNIKQTVKNLKLLTKVRKNIVDEVLTEAYQKRVKTFTNEYPAIQSLNNGYFKGIEAAFDPNRELYNQIVQKSIQTTSASLLDSGIDQNVIEPIIRIVDDSVSTGATFTDMVDELRTVIKGDPERLGNLMRYSKQITQDALNQFNGIYNETIAKDLDLEWYYYSGGKRRTSRPFCKKYAGKYFHKKEVEDFGKRKDLDGSNLCGGSSKTDLCQGRIPSTNSSSIFRYRAGYNCKHVYKPTMIDAVPKNVIDRNIKKGYYVPEGEEGKEIEFNNLDDANKWLKDNNIKVDYDKNVSEGQKLSTINSLSKSSSDFEKKLNVKFGTKINNGREFGDINFVKKVKVINDKDINSPLAEYLRSESAYGEADSLFINLSKVSKEIDFKSNISEIKGGKIPLYNLKNMSDVINHEAGHNYYFSYSLKKIKAYKKTFEADDAWQIAPSIYGQENASEFFAESLVSFLRGDKNKSTEYINNIFKL